MALFTTIDLEFQLLLKSVGINTKNVTGLTLFLDNCNIQQMSLYRSTHCFQVKNEALKRKYLLN